MNMSFDHLLDSANEQTPKCESTYADEDGLLRCAVCHKRVQVKMPYPFGNGYRIQNCICDCVEKEETEDAKRKKQEAIERRRRTCFSNTNMASWTFENDDLKNEKLSNAMKRYVWNFKEFKREGKGLLMYGPVGTGKTYYAACIANELLEEGYRAYMTNFAQLTNKLQGMYDGKQEFIDNLNEYDLLIIDDLGIERRSGSGYVQEIVFNVVDSRYRAGLPMIITTNLTPNEIKSTSDVVYQRIYDRIIERCFPLEVKGASRRREALRNTNDYMKAMLGLEDE